MTPSDSISYADDLTDLFETGESLFIENEIERAKACFQKILRENPEHAGALNNLGVISFGEGDAETARAFLEKALTVDPAYKDALLNLAEVPGTDPLSFAVLAERVLQSHPGDPEIIALAASLPAALAHETQTPMPVPQKAFFILSPGRSAMATLERIVGLSSDVALHSERDPETLSALKNGAGDPACFRKMRSRPLDAAARGGLVFGEATPLLVPYAAAIAAELPASKFLVVVRNPEDFVCSALAQNFYQGHPDDDLRCVPATGSALHVQWRNLSQLEKICWLWTSTYQTLLDALEPLGPGRCRCVKLEDLRPDAPAIQEIFDFLSIGGYNSEQVGKILGLGMNAHNYRHFPSAQDWSDEVRNLVADRCGALAHRLGYAPATSRPAPTRPRHAPVPAVSVGLPLYSGGAMLADSLECFLAQDFGDFEIIVSDHGSDPMVREVAEHFASQDRRIRYHLTQDRMRCIGASNFMSVVELARAPFFLWGSYDDRIEKTYIGKCLEPLRADRSVVLAYSRSKVIQNHSRDLGPGNDVLHADMDDPCERFVHVIRELAMCNAFYGIFRRETLRRTRALRRDAYAHDNLLLAEIALAGKIVQIDEPLFIRNLTRNYDRSYEEHHTDMIRSLDFPWLETGITLPFCRLTYCHCELVNYSALSMEQKELLTAEIVRCFKSRWGQQLDYEITRAVGLVQAGCFFRTWDGRHYGPQLERAANLRHFHVADVVKALSEALFLFPERNDLREAYVKTLQASEALSARPELFSGDAHVSLPDLQSRH